MPPRAKYDPTYKGDNLTPEQRRRTMQAVRRRDTSPEIALRHALRDEGLVGYRVDWPKAPGRPDVAFPGRRVAVFVDGAFWHGRPDRVRPGRSAYWDGKIARNRKRDLANDAALRQEGWRVLRLWDDEVLRDDSIALRVKRLLEPFRIGEFFAGIGLVGLGLEEVGEVVFANDIDAWKYRLFASNIDPSNYVLRDVRDIRGGDVPDLDLATASFPCTDLSLAGNRRGLAGHQSGMFWEFARVLEEMGERKPRAILLENVPSFATSHGGQDLRDAIFRLNQLGYACDLLLLDARYFVAQSRPRLFIVGSQQKFDFPSDWSKSPIRPAWIRDFVVSNRRLVMQALPLQPPEANGSPLSSCIERLSADDGRWWNKTQVIDFRTSLSPVQARRLRSLASSEEVSWATAYRRTRHGKAVWEIRHDSISGCLRTARGGSSRQALVEAGDGIVRVRWMTSREYAALQGAPGFRIPDDIPENRALFGFGDAVCVPVIQWLGRHYLRPLLEGQFSPSKARQEESYA
ncbi:MAG: DNA mismatch endonuclease Vsr [Chloroflexi bacterium]|nr:DNA mismatch endonuclease Vsr [Chloroflexota bacterium]